MAEADDAFGAVTPLPLALATRATADFESLQDHRITELQHFRVGQPRIGHMRVNGTRAIKTRTRTRAATDGFVILIFRIAEIGVVHGALCRRHRTQRAEQRIGNRLARLHIARHNCGRIFR